LQEASGDRLGWAVALDEQDEPHLGRIGALDAEPVAATVSDDFLPTAVGLVDPERHWFGESSEFDSHDLSTSQDPCACST